MFRAVLRSTCSAVQTVVRSQARLPAVVTVPARNVMQSADDLQEAADEQFNQDVLAMLGEEETDGWRLREIITAIVGRDAVPEPEIIIGVMRACRRLNDYALAVRFLESAERKCGIKKKEIWPWVAQEIQPTLDELGILTPEQMGYDKPELATPDVFEMH